MELEEYPVIRPAIKGKTFRIPDLRKEIGIALRADRVRRRAMEGSG